MTADPVMVSPEESAVKIAREMFERRIHRVVVVDEEKLPVGMITSLDLLGALSHQAGSVTRHNRPSA
jgi:CBS domain-containing protein